MRATIELSQGTIHYRDDGAGEPIVFVDPASPVDTVTTTPSATAACGSRRRK